MGAGSPLSSEPMPTPFEIARHKEELKRQLLRRIGYTEGLFDLLRFARIISDIQPLLPLPQEILANRIQQLGLEHKYASGILDVMRALGLAQRAGPRFSLSTSGRALFALVSLDLESAIRAFFLSTVVDADGDYTLNLFRLLKESPHAADESFFDRILRLIEIRQSEVNHAIKDKFLRDIATGYLANAQDSIREKILGQPSERTKGFRQRLEAAQRNRFSTTSARGEPGTRPAGPTETVKHTVSPRRGWLQDLGLVGATRTAGRTVSEAGLRLWEALDCLGFLTDLVVRVPYDAGLLAALQLSGLPELARDRYFELAACAYVGRTNEPRISVEDFVDLGRRIHHFTRLAHFDQSHGESIYLALASILAAEGQVLTRHQFGEFLDAAVSQYPAQVNRLSHRWGGLGYIVFR